MLGTLASLLFLLRAGKRMLTPGFSQARPFTARASLAASAPRTFACRTSRPTALTSCTRLTRLRKVTQPLLSPTAEPELRLTHPRRRRAPHHHHSPLPCARKDGRQEDDDVQEVCRLCYPVQLPQDGRARVRPPSHLPRCSLSIADRCLDLPTVTPSSLPPSSRPPSLASAPLWRTRRPRLSPTPRSR